MVMTPKAVLKPNMGKHYIQRLTLMGEQPTTMRPWKVLPSQQTGCWVQLPPWLIARALMGVQLVPT